MVGRKKSAIFLIYLVITMVYHTAVAKSSGKVEKAKKELARFGKSNVIKDGKSSLKDAGLLQDTKNSDEAESLVDSIQNSIVEKFETFEFDKDEIGSALASGVSKGFPDLVKGFQTKQWYYALSGTLKILTALTTATGPYGAIAAPILKLLTIILNMYGAPVQESQEDMIKRVFKDALMEEFKSEAHGVRTEYETLQSQIELLRERKNKNNVLNMIELEELHFLSYDNFAIFGKLKNKITENCFPGRVTNPEQVSAPVKRCFDILNMYCQLSLMRQMMLGQLAALSEEKQQPNLKDSFMNLLKQAQTTDHQILKFLAKPMENPGARYVIYILYARQHQYPIIIEYLQRLAIRDEVVSKENVEIRTNFDKENAMFCSEEHLQGNCRLIRKEDEGSTGRPASYPANWGSITKSLFVPPDVRVKAKNVDSEKYMGPFHGLAVYSGDELGKMSEIQVLPGTIGTSDTVMVCIGEGWCQVVEELSGEQSLKSLGGNDFSSIKTLIVPEEFQVTLLANNAIASNKQLGPVFGRMVVTKFCDSDWDDIIVKKLDSSAAHYPVVCDDAGFGGYCQQLGQQFVDKATELDSLEDTRHSINKYSVCSADGVKSIKIPAGFKVYLYTKDDILNGPHIGPAELASLGSVDITKAMVTKVSGRAEIKPSMKRSQDEKSTAPKQVDHGKQTGSVVGGNVDKDIKLDAKSITPGKVDKHLKLDAKSKTPGKVNHDVSQQKSNVAEKVFEKSIKQRSGSKRKEVATSDVIKRFRALSLH